MELEEAIKHCKNNLENWKKDRPDLSNTEIVEEIDYDYKAIETVLKELDVLKFKYQARKDRTDTIIKNQEKMIENAKDRIEYYLMGNSKFDDFYEREKELEKLLNILKAEESE